MKQAKKVFNMIFISYNQAPIILKPGKQPLNLPSSPISTKFTSILSMLLFSVNFMRRNQFNVSVLRKLLVKFVAVIGLVADKPIRGIWGKTTIYRRLNQLHFMGRSAFNVSGDRKTREDEGTDVRISVSLDIAEIWITEKLT